MITKNDIATAYIKYKNISEVYHVIYYVDRLVLPSQKKFLKELGLPLDLTIWTEE